MGFFDTAQRDLSKGLSVFYGELFEVWFTSGTAYYWDGFGDLNAHSHTWRGAGALVTRSEIPFGIDDEAGDLTLTLSGVDATVVSMVRASEAEIYHRPILIWGQFFGEDLQIPVSGGDRWLIYRGTMDVPTYGISSFDTRTIAIPCESEWSDRNTAKNSLFSDADQKRRYPGDRGLEYVYRYTTGVTRDWPNFP